MEGKSMKKILFGVVFGALALSSCIDDKGHYDYTPSNSVIFDEEAEHRLTFTFGTEAEITAPILETTDPEMGDTFTYYWYKVDGNSYELLYEVTDPVLKFQVDQVAYPRWMLRVKNNRTGVFFRDPKEWQILVTRRYATGYVFLTQKDDNTIGLDMWDNFEGEYRLEKNLLELFSGPEFTPFPTSGKGIDVVTVNNSPTNDGRNQNTWLPMWPLYILTDTYSGIVNNENFAKGKTLTETVSRYSTYVNGGDMVATKMITQGIKGNAPRDRGAVAFFVPSVDDPDHGNWFWGNMINPNASDPIFQFENAVNILSANYQNPVGNEEPMSKHAVLMPANKLLVMWSDEKQKFFVKTNTGSFYSGAGYLTSRWLEDTDQPGEDDVVVTYDEQIGDVFDVALPGREMVYMASSMSSVTGNEFYAVVKDPEEGYRFIYFTNPSNAGTFRKGNAYNFPDNTEVGTAKFFASGRDLSAWPAIYFVTADGKRVKAFNLTQGGTEVNVALATPADHEIVAFKSFGPSLNFADPVNQQVFVVTRDPSLPDDECCTFTVYDRGTNDSSLSIATYDKEVDDGEGGTTTVPTPMQVSGIGLTVAFTFKQG